ncbi:hypothetical protein LJC25_02980 [Bacteroidales bacterium OttesenSCG-928-K03]|nr:hypothetical protein [Bacteroidales bacterium OttesenSCG-928-L14]MDL2241039.1 hypothetical protein [Bacteroidales bacterium OttesenSCG-928-K22]MDL2242673.1 hypothetical protein [Bacteroidales bacterium OttesenSCG-928-K03]
MEKILFEEKQYFRQWWLFIMLLPIVGIFVYGLIKQIFFDIPFGNNPMSDLGLIISSILIIIICLMMFFIGLETRITNYGIYIKFFPFNSNFKFFPWDDIASHEVIKYKPIRDYGGWGIRGSGKNKAYNVSGNYGLMLKFYNGNKLLIGTNKPDELKNQLKN